MNPLERQLRGAFEEAHAVAKSELGFGMPVLLKMVAEAGPTEAARRILPSVTDMYTKLYLRHRLDLSVEAIVLRPEFRSLFTEAELGLASTRLRDSSYDLAEVDDPEELENWARLARKARSQWDSENPY